VEFSNNFHPVFKQRIFNNFYYNEMFKTVLSYEKNAKINTLLKPRAYTIYEQS